MHKLYFLIKVLCFESYQAEKSPCAAHHLLSPAVQMLQLGKMCPSLWYICFASCHMLAVTIFIILPGPDRQHLYLQVPGSFPHLLPFSEPVADH